MPFPTELLISTYKSLESKCYKAKFKQFLNLAEPDAGDCPGTSRAWRCVSCYQELSAAGYGLVAVLREKEQQTPNPPLLYSFCMFPSSCFSPLQFHLPLSRCSRVFPGWRSLSLHLLYSCLSEARRAVILTARPNIIRRSRQHSLRPAAPVFPPRSKLPGTCWLGHLRHSRARAMPPASLNARCQPPPVRVLGGPSPTRHTRVCTSAMQLLLTWDFALGSHVRAILVWSCTNARSLFPNEVDLRRNNFSNG